MDTRVAIYSPPDPNAVANIDAVGAVDQSAGNWTLEGYDWVGFTIQSSAPGQVGHQSGVVQSVELTMRRRVLDLDYRMKVLNGPWLGRYLYIESIGFEDARARLVSVICRLASQS